MPATLTTLVRPADITSCQPPAAEKRLLATVAHELRSPLASLRLSLDMLVNNFDDLDSQAALGLVYRAQRSTSWLQSLAQNLSSAASAESGSLDVRCAPVDVLECVEEAVQLVRCLLEQRGQTVRVARLDAAQHAFGDAARIIQVVANLLTNASRYSVDGDEIEIVLSTVGWYVCVRVADHGPGISAEDQQHIFGAWVRGQGAGGGGLGLGLSIVESLVAEQGGRLGVESALGAGATFWFTLPCRP